MTILERLSHARDRLAQTMDLQDAFAFGGVALVTVGAAQVYGPLGFIVPGAFFMWLGTRRSG